MRLSKGLVWGINDPFFEDEMLRIFIVVFCLRFDQSDILEKEWRYVVWTGL